MVCGVVLVRRVRVAQEAAGAAPAHEEAAAEGSEEEEGEGEGDADAEYDARDDELDAPRDYDDYTDNAHLSHHHD